MDVKLHRWVQRHGWDRAVEAYQAHWRTQLRPAHDAVLAAAVLTPGERVLDVACGTGLLTLPAAHAVGPTGRVVATDLSPAMVADTARRAEAAGLGHVVVRATDAADLGPIDELAPFDVALCGLGLMYVPDPDQALRELARVLRPGGRAVLAVWGERRHCGWAEIFPVVERRVSSDVCPLFFGLGAPGALAARAGRAGFVDIAERQLRTQLEYATDEDAIGAAFVGGPVALANARFDEATRAAAHAEYLASIARYRDDGGRYRVPGEFVVVSGRTSPPTPSVVRSAHRQPPHHQPPQHQEQPT